MKINILILMAVLATGCHAHNSSHKHMHDEDGHEHSEAVAHRHEGHSHEGEAHEHAGETHAANEIVFESHRQELFGVRTELAKKMPFSTVIKAGGQIKAAADDNFELTAPTSGIIHFTISPMTAGTRIADGRTLAVISSEELAGGNQMTKLKAAYDAARAAYLRDSSLVSESIIQKGHFEQSRLNYVNAKTEYEALASRAQEKGVQVSAKSNAFLRSLVAAEGQFVEAGSTIALLTKGRRLTLEADVPAKYASSLSSVLDANFTVPSGDVLSVKDLGGRFVSRSYEATDGYITVAFEVPDHGQLVSGCYADVWLKAAGSGNQIVLPLGSVIEEQGTHSVFVKMDEDCFVKRPVTIGGNDGKSVEILSGISEGEEVVTDGAIQIKLASVSAVPAGHSHNH